MQSSISLAVKMKVGVVGAQLEIVERVLSEFHGFYFVGCTLSQVRAPDVDPNFRPNWFEPAIRSRTSLLRQNTKYR